MTILVTGATGNVGAHLVRILSTCGERVRTFDRRTDRLDRALDGVDQLFLACGNVPEQVDFECAAIDAAAAAGVALVVKLSGPAASVDSPRLFERAHGVIERQLAGSGLPAVRLRPRAFLTNLLAYAGSSVLRVPAGRAEISFVDPRDVAEVAAAALTRPGHAGRTYTLTGPAAITFERVAAELADATGRPITYADVPDDRARQAMISQGLPPPLADAIVAIFADQRTGSMAPVTDTVRQVTGRDPRTITAFAREHAALFAPADPASIPVTPGGRPAR